MEKLLHCGHFKPAAVELSESVADRLAVAQSARYRCRRDGHYNGGDVRRLLEERVPKTVGGEGEAGVRKIRHSWSRVWGGIPVSFVFRKSRLGAIQKRSGVRK